MSIADNIARVRAEIASAAARSGRKPEDIRLIAVSKTKPISMIKEAVGCGALDLGENKPQELDEKFPSFEGSGVRWHMIGHLQKNKVRRIINKRAFAADKLQDILIQVNVSGEDSKFGVRLEEASELCKRISELASVRIKGLMTISMRGLDHDGNRDIFLRLAQLADGIGRENIHNVSMKELSMGMTHDFEAAIEAGATMIRVGTAIFGERNYNV